MQDKTWVKWLKKLRRGEGLFTFVIGYQLLIKLFGEMRKIEEAAMITSVRELSIALFKANTFKFGTFTLPTGHTVNAYFDLTIVFSIPSLLDGMCHLTSLVVKRSNISCQAICGVSYSGIPIAVVLAQKLQKPLLMRNKEIRYSAEEKRIDGVIFEGGYCLVVEEVMCSGASTLEVIKDIEDTGMRVKDVIVIMDLQQGGVESLEKLGYTVHPVCNIVEVAKILYEEKEINGTQCDNIIKGWTDKFAINGDCINNTKLYARRGLRYSRRIKYCKSEAAKNLLEMICVKETNLCVNFATNNVNELLEVANLIGPYICILAIHVDALHDIRAKQIDELKNISTKHKFLLMDDRKLSEEADVVLLHCNRLLQIVDFLTVHMISGENIARRITSALFEFKKKGIFVVSDPVVKDALVGSSYENEARKFTIEHIENVAGFICHKNADLPIGYIHMMPDVHTTGASASCKSKNSYYSPEVVIGDIAADIVMVNCDNCETIVDFVKSQRTRLWDAYQKRQLSAPSNA